MKKAVALTHAIVLTLTLAACGAPGKTPGTIQTPSPTSGSIELTVFAAASMTESLNKVIDLYKTAAPNVSITTTYDSSGTLMTQISEGAYCDLFISAAQKQMNALDVSQGTDTNPKKLDFIDPGTRVNILENKVVLVVPKDNPAKVKSFRDLANVKMIALGNSDVPVGSYSLAIFKTLGLDITALEKAGKITYGSNVKEVTTHVSEGAVDCGIVYATDAYSAGLTVVDTATTEMCGQVIYPAAVLKGSKNANVSKAFLDFLKTDGAMAEFKKVGFSPVK